ncbi:MAG: trehalose-phosphatase [Candidatus Binatia bacterium]
MPGVNFDAIIFDLDGVVTDTAKVHSTAWKELFDSYLRTRESRDKEPFSPFDKELDYLSYIDGKPRYDGVRSFLKSRGIGIPYGHASDEPDQETICGLGNKKNKLFAEILERDGVEVFQSTLDLITEAKSHGIRVAIVSSSKNCLTVLKIAHIENLFDARVDGVVSASLGLKGKPNPDIFTKSAEILGADTSRSVVVEDSIAGVEAGKAGKFGMVIGVDRRGHSATLREKGANLVVKDLSEISVRDIQAWFSKHGHTLPSALDRKKEIQQQLSDKRVVLFLDYDGTLTPIVDRPEMAVMSSEMREVVRQLAASCTTAIVSGRSRAKVYDFVQVDGLIYAGSHGFDIAGPDRSLIQHEEGKRFLPAIDSVYRKIAEQLDGVEGALVEHTGFSISVHYRLVAEDQVPVIEGIVDQVLEDNPTLRKTYGKKVFELRPRMDWDKGKAVLWILRALELDQADVLPVYLGDDTTDEDAFRVVRERGIAILVAEAPRPSAASYSLRDTREVKLFLEALTAMVRERNR